MPADGAVGGVDDSCDSVCDNGLVGTALPGAEKGAPDSIPLLKLCINSAGSLYVVAAEDK
ncbi:hypothetical protein AWC27_00215 [Mycobacterium szulgai]|uniref:Uncharacterized protein n=1 Tax=Mycobacterium szulgai TaxID=1787 RepID=A0A1X2EGX5_MYCSZ|nr:hypothetical protein AWC27_00215 [Mycobacterium szulgai]